jgi:UDP-N-acetyl-D-galactosamine dehydrogenase
MSLPKIAVIGLGYVGLPLARLFATIYQVVGFDINQIRIDSLNAGTDSTLEVSDAILQEVLVKDLDTVSSGLLCSSSLTDIANCNYYVVTVPTPVDKNKRPDLTPLYRSSETVGIYSLSWSNRRRMCACFGKSFRT